MIEVGLLMVGGVGGQFLGRREGIELRLGKIELKMVVGRILVDQIRIRTGIVFLNLG